MTDHKASKPSFTLSEQAADTLAHIIEKVTRLEYGTGFKKDLKLQRANRLRTIHSSLAIEGNSLSLDEVTAVLGGKLVAGRQEEIKEVKNAYAAYDQIMRFDPYSVSDFLEAHRLMTTELVAEAGAFRRGDVGVFQGSRAIHLGARPQFVPQLVEELFDWARQSTLHPVLKSAVMHYEIEIIHPFADGNGRMGRLWQTLILAKWNPLFAWIPMETLLFENRPAYYEAIRAASSSNDAGVFIAFSLGALLDSLIEQEKHQEKHQDEHQDNAKPQLVLSELALQALRAVVNMPLSRKELFVAMDLAGDSRAFKRHIEPLLKAGLLEMTVPDKPNSKLQRYRITGKGITMLADHKGEEQ